MSDNANSSRALAAIYRTAPAPEEGIAANPDTTLTDLQVHLVGALVMNDEAQRQRYIKAFTNPATPQDEKIEATEVLKNNLNANIIARTLKAAAGAAQNTKLDWMLTHFADRIGLKDFADALDNISEGYHAEPEDSQRRSDYTVSARLLISHLERKPSLDVSHEEIRQVLARKAPAADDAQGNWEKQLEKAFSSDNGGVIVFS